MGWGRRTVPSNGHVVATTYYTADAWANQMASLGLATNTFSPMSAGTHGPSTQRRGFTGLPGYGVNRFEGETAYQLGTKQDVAAPSSPVLDPLSRRLGIGAGVAGQPGMPGTGADASGYGGLAAMSSFQMRPGL